VRKVTESPGARRADLAAIHIVKAALGWDDDTYRDVMSTVCGVRSSTAMDRDGRKRWLAHLQACAVANGLQPAKPAKAPRKPWSAPQRLVWSLWQQLAEADLVQRRDRAGLDAWIKLHQAGVDRLEFCNAQQLDLVIAGLRQWLKRAPEIT